MHRPNQIATHRGKLGVLLPGMGAVASTFLAGCFLTQKGLASPTGSLTQLGTIRLGKRTDDRVPLIRDFVPLASLNDLVFGGWDVFEDNMLEAARTAGVLEEKHLAPVAAELEAIRPMPAAFYPEDVKRLHGPHTKKTASKAEMVERLRDDIRSFKRDQGVDRLVAVWCGSTERYVEAGEAHQSIAKFEKALERDDPRSRVRRSTRGRASKSACRTRTVRRTSAWIFLRRLRSRAKWEYLSQARTSRRVKP
jgi:myo-inositol-1-phosphate synthase